MLHALIVVIFCIGLGLYGKFLANYVSGRTYTTANLTAAAISVIYVALAGVSLDELGLSFNHIIRGLLVGLVVISVGFFITAVYLKVRRRQLGKISPYEIYVRIPLGTALAEEVIFRGSLLALLLHFYSSGPALVISSFIFGLWHLLPSEMANWAHTNMPSRVSRKNHRKLISASATVLFTFAGGI